MVENLQFVVVLDFVSEAKEEPLNQNHFPQNFARLSSSHVHLKCQMYQVHRFQYVRIWKNLFVHLVDRFLPAVYPSHIVHLSRMRQTQMNCMNLMSLLTRNMSKKELDHNSVHPLMELVLNPLNPLRKLIQLELKQYQ